jgi:hypothetical protein
MRSVTRGLRGAAAAAAGAALIALGAANALTGGGTGAVFLSRVLSLPASAARLAARPPFIAAPPVGGARSPVARWRVGVQAGHWNIAALPDEQWRLRTSTGGRHGRLAEVDINRGLADRVVGILTAAGIDAELIPATVPPGYDADAFVAIHADDGNRGAERGWKVAAPWRASDASRLLRDSLGAAYRGWTGMPEDRYGVTFNMRGYYAFSWYRFLHAIAPTTPAAIIETGFISSAEDRAVLTGEPETAARGIAAGIITYLSRAGAPRPEALVARAYPPMRVGAGGAALRILPGEAERSAGFLPEGTLVRPVGEEGGWVDLIVWGNYRLFGWMRQADLEPAGA